MFLNANKTARFGLSLVDACFKQKQTLETRDGTAQVERPALGPTGVVCCGKNAIAISGRALGAAEENHVKVRGF
jgi:hypothetical protein